MTAFVGFPSYFVVGDTNPTTQVWDSYGGALVTNTAAAYHSWVANGGRTETGQPQSRVLNAVNNGSGAIRLTLDNVTSEMITNDVWVVQNVGGVTNANNTFAIMVITAGLNGTIDLQGSVFAGAYTSGGVIDRGDPTATMAGLLSKLDSFNMQLYATTVFNGVNTNTFSGADITLTNPMKLVQSCVTPNGKALILPKMNIPGSIPIGVPFIVLSSTGGGGAVVVKTTNGFSVLQANELDSIMLCLARNTSVDGSFTKLFNPPNLIATLRDGGTHSDLSATGGAHQFLKQSSAGADITVGRPASTDLSDLPIPVSSGGSGAATLTGILLGNGTGAFTTLSYTAPTIYSPTDQSGTGLSFSSVDFNYEQTGNLVYLYGTLTYPVTADGSNARISLPVSVVNSSRGQIPCQVINNGGVLNLTLLADQGAATASFHDFTTGVNKKNSDMSAARVRFMLIYPAT